MYIETKLKNSFYETFCLQTLEDECLLPATKAFRFVLFSPSQWPLIERLWMLKLTQIPIMHHNRLRCETDNAV